MSTTTSEVRLSSVSKS